MTDTLVRRSQVLRTEEEEISHSTRIRSHASKKPELEYERYENDEKENANQPRGFGTKGRAGRRLSHKPKGASTTLCYCHLLLGYRPSYVQTKLYEKICGYQNGTLDLGFPPKHDFVYR